MLIGKIFSLRKIDNITMDAHLTKIKNVVDQLEEIGMSLHEDIIVHLPNDMTLTCSKRCRLAMINFQLTRCLKPSYWAKRILKGLLQKTVERHLWWKVIGIHLVIQGIVDFKFNKTQMFFSRGLNNKYHCLMAQGNNSNNFQNTNSFSTTRQLGHNSTNNH